MPSATQTREERLTRIYNHFKKQEENGAKLIMMDPIYHSTRKLFPLISKKLAKDYASTVFLMLQGDSDGN